MVVAVDVRKLYVSSLEQTKDRQRSEEIVLRVVEDLLTVLYLSFPPISANGDMTAAAVNATTDRMDRSATTTTIKSPLIIYIQRTVWVQLKQNASSAHSHATSFTVGGMMSKCTEFITFSAGLVLPSCLAPEPTFTALARRRNVKRSGEVNKETHVYHFSFRNI
ncbi:ubiquitin specific peptidase 30 (C19 family) [Echinococcus multilocularis]|uniref:Ubiquitin specific peptidase 30 (C19 family) n=1 Tax=Echinococcus multilocularis TaxID=6211 RepID=A0A0S4MLB4_ECHMU|nr:ubiquitin specific peptidase 30 (C19 family) [Echinococcus multilocularis]